MSILPKPETTETPAGEGGADPKADSTTTAPGAGASAAPGSTAGGTPSTGAPSGSSSPGAGGPAAGANAADPKADFERKLSSLADLEMTVSQRAKAIEALEAKYKGYEGLGAALPEGITAEMLAEALGKLKAGDEVTFVKAMFSPLKKWSEDSLIRLADGFDAEELSVEERVERKLAAEKKAEADAKAERERKATEEAEARRKKEHDDAVADAGRQLDEHTKGASKWLVANIAKYPLIQAMDDDDDVDHVQLFRKGVIDYADKHDKLPTDEEGLSAMRAEIFDKIEARHRRQLDRLVPKPRNLREEMSEFDRIELYRAKEKERAAVEPPPRAPGPRTGAEEALARLEAWEREQAERDALSYGR